MEKRDDNLGNFAYLFNFFMDIAIIVTFGVLIYRVMNAMGFPDLLVFAVIGSAALYTGIRPQLLRQTFDFFYIKEKQ